MLAAIPYRGPDGMHALAWPAAVLGHARLALTAEDEAEQQPLVSAQSGCAVVADARLDNRDELLAQLPACPRTASDAELILRAYERWGLEAPERFLGDFAFVIWDERAHRLVCARDGGAQRPLFYRQDHQVFAVASEVHQLLQEPTVRLAPNDDRIRDALVPFNLHRNEKDRPDTFYAGIRAVQAGELLVVDERSLQAWRYWTLKPPPEIRYRRRVEYAEHFRELLFEAVRARLRTSRPLGVMLSGGLDSTSVTCVAQELYRAGQAVDHGFAALSLGYDGLECDESAFITATRAKYGFSSHRLAPDLSIEALSDEPAGFRERPSLTTSGFDTLLRFASHLGVPVLLTGEISDSYVRGAPLALDSLLRAGRVGAFWRYLEAYRTLAQDPWLKIAALYVIAPFLPLPVHRALGLAYARREFGRSARQMLPPWMPEAMRARLLDRQLDLSLAEERGRQCSSEARHWDLLGLWPPEAMALPAGWPIELRRPFADRRLQEFVLAVPPPEKYEPHPSDPGLYAGSKQLIRRGLAGIVPEPVLARTEQTHFASAAVERIRRQWTVLERWFGRTARPRIAERGYVEPGAFWSRLQQVRDGRLGLDFLHLDYCLGLEAWLRSLEQPRQEAVTVRSSWRAPCPEAALSGNSSTVSRRTID
jgi:asparagine synthase (glutamine-hydrolysing)